MYIDDEDRVSEFLEGFELNPLRYNKEEKRSLGKTPDFKVENTGRLHLYCEVKSVVGDNFEGSRNDPTYNGMQNRIHESVKQFRSVNPLHEIPNVLAFINHQHGTDIIDLYSVLTGNFYSEKGEKFPIFTKYSHGRILKEKHEIDLYLWFQDDNEPHLCFNTDSRFMPRLCGMLNVNIDEIRSV